MHHFFLCVHSGINIQLKCSHGSGFVWNPLSPTSHRLRDTHHPLETHTHTQNEGRKTMEFLVFPKWQHGMEKSSLFNTHACRSVSEAWSVCCVLMCPLCATSAKHWWQGRQKLCVCAPTSVSEGVFAQVHSSWFREIKFAGGDGSRLRQALKWTLWRLSAHISAHTHSLQRSVQGVGVVCSLSLRPGGKARLTKPGWHSQELREQRLDFYIRALGPLYKGSLWGNPIHRGVTAAGQDLVEAFRSLCTYRWNK